ncbi:hypothetical protein LTR62_006632 [Meristemomyces frigidus]|uniref:Helicase C-terminal domain-containing protein n=1 Tax=Meristemomyces frigidus TaxID=1508187 RepID=A0AAN7TVL8_9PEZI|nr:hypothetical protein LTR62_006632 [Meristemomyces frigidus]
MATPRLTHKRKAEQDHVSSAGSDSDSIFVVSSTRRKAPSSQQTTHAPARLPLQEIQQNKRQRKLQYVLIPKPDAVEPTSPPPVAACTILPSERAASRTTARIPALGKFRQPSIASFISDSRAVTTDARFTGPLDMLMSNEKSKHNDDQTETQPISTTRAKQIPKPPNTVVMRSTSVRARRSTGRVSYAAPITAGDSSGDEIIPKRLIKARRKPVIEDDDYEHDPAEEDEPVATSSEDEDMQDSSDSDPCEVVSDLDDEMPKKPSKAPPSRGAKTGMTASISSAKPTSKGPTVMRRLLVRRSEGLKGVKGLDTSLPPMSDISEIFADLTQHALRLGLRKTLAHLDGKPLRLATFCSGTEAPLVAFNMISAALKAAGEPALDIKHVCSAEIVPVKQAFIERNYAPDVIFRDIVEIMRGIEENPVAPEATTAYGAKFSVPKDVDILVAGTSCVDYSSQNNKKKGITDGGESGQTWFATLSYCMWARPAMVIFENVLNADWNAMQKYYHDIGYVSEGVMVDSKDYYMPHTRQRGYMVCIDVTKLASKDDPIAPERWQDLMEDLKRPASSPVSDFRLAVGDLSIRPAARDDDLRKEVDWAACEVRHIQHRLKMNISDVRPFLQWQEGGKLSVPEYGARAWYSRQVDRVKDTWECLGLVKANRDKTDIRYKSHIFDLSQNVDRIPTTVPTGITGCILPTAISFASDAGRVLTAEELLALQGLPIRDIILGSETQAELQDLAGNAMSVPVIGAALAAALITGYSTIKTTCSGAPGAEKTHQPASALKIEPAPVLETVSYDRVCKPIDVNHILRLADLTARKCYCEDNNDVASRPLQQCVDCGHTTCVACGGNPPHNYRPMYQPSATSPSDFESLLNTNLPLKLQFEPVAELEPSLGNSCDALSKAQFSAYKTAAERAFSSVFSFQRVERVHIWRACYWASAARLELFIGLGGLEWQLFAVPYRHLPLGDRLRLALQFPIAIGRVHDKLLTPRWELRLPTTKVEALEVLAGPVKVPSWWSRLGLPDYENHTTPQTLEVKATSDTSSALHDLLIGEYIHRPKCGMACGSLYVKVCKTGERPVYLFLDPTRIGVPDADEFVFSHDKKAHLDYGEQRSILARVKAPWRPWTFSDVRNVKAQIVANQEAVPPPSSVRLRSAIEELHISRAASSGLDVVNSGCDAAACLISCAFSDIDKPARNESLVLADHIDLMPRYAWIFNVMQQHLAHDTWKTLAPSANQELSCQNCYPAKPEMRWRLAEDKKSIEPYEDPKLAATYERAIKQQPKRIGVTIEQAASGETVVSLGVNVAALAHSAAARLPKSASNVAVAWKLDTSPPSTSYKNSPFTMKSAEGCTPTALEFPSGLSLFPEQQRALSWLRSQEKGIGYEVEEAEEATLPGVRWRAEVRAAGTVTVRGGICADHPGFGKTIMSLALVKLDEDKDSIKEISPRAEGLLASTATLIVCPATLVDQWIGEIKSCFLSQQGVIAIHKPADLLKYKDEQFQKAKVIVLNRSVLATESYVERLAAFVGIPGPASMAVRAYSKWLQYARTRLTTHLDILKGKGSSALKAHIKSVYAQTLKSDALQGVVPSRRLRGQEYVAANASSKSKKAQTSKASKAAATTIDTEHVDRPILEKFYFNRIIVDEYHQYEPREFTAAASLRADKRWGLSGTPALGDLYDVAQLGILLDVPLRIGSDARGIMKTRNIRTLRKDMTDAEIFEAKMTIPSPAMHAREHEKGQEFLDTFVRRNKADFADMPIDECLVAAPLEIPHLLLYTELSQQLNSADMKMVRGRNALVADRDERVTQVVASSGTPEEALARMAAFWRPDLHGFGTGVLGLLEQRNDVLQGIREKLGKALVEAHRSEPEPFARWKEAQLVRKGLHDIETIQSLEQMIETLRLSGVSQVATKKRTATKASDEDEEGGLKAGNGAVDPKTKEVYVLSKRSVAAIRSLRFVQNAQRALQHMAGYTKLSTCHSSKCAGDLENRVVDIAVSARCGHLLCRSCYLRMLSTDHARCQSIGCNADALVFNLLWTSKLGDGHQVSSQTAFGAKLARAMDILSGIHAKGEKAIMFVQNADQLDQAERALTDRDVPAFVVRSGDSASMQIKKFQDGEKTVIVLDAADETAVGLNLQNANHVLFLSPLLRDSQYEYESVKAQTIGRVRRHGQTKPIKVYTVFSPFTIDVDILEHRERRTDAITELHAGVVERPAIAEALDVRPTVLPERTQLVKEEGVYSLRPQSWLTRCTGADCGDGDDIARVQGRGRVMGWEDYSSLVKFSRAYAEDDD